MQLIDEANAALSTALASRIIDIYGNKGNQEQLEFLEKIYFFSPLKGNVIFGSAYDNWGFTIDDFLDIIAEKFKKYKFKKEGLKKCLWGNYYFNPKTKKISSKPINSQHYPMFAEFILKNIFNIYEKVRYDQDEDWIAKMAKKFGTKIQPFQLKNIKTEWQTIAAVKFYLKTNLIETFDRLAASS